MIRVHILLRDGYLKQSYVCMSLWCLRSLDRGPWSPPPSDSSTTLGLQRVLPTGIAPSGCAPRCRQQPSLFLAGLGDMTLPMFGGVDGIKKTLADFCEQMEEPIFVDGAGHWIAEEKPADVNDAVLAFATKHVALFSPAALPEGVPGQPVD